MTIGVLTQEGLQNTTEYTAVPKLKTEYYNVLLDPLYTVIPLLQNSTLVPGGNPLLVPVSRPVLAHRY